MIEGRGTASGCVLPSTYPDAVNFPRCAADQAMKKSRRPSRTQRPQFPKKKSVGELLDFHPSRIKPERLEAFREAYIESKGNAARAVRAIGMTPAYAKTSAWRLVRALNLRVADCLEMLGGDAASQARKLAALREARMPKWNPGEEQWDIFVDSGTQLGATIEINKLRDEYLAVKERQLPVNPVTVIFNTDLSQYEGEDYAPRTIELRPGFQNQPQGNAGGGTPECAITRSSLRDAAKGSGHKKE